MDISFLVDPNVLVQLSNVYDDLMDTHDDFCFSCEKGGHLYLCDTCDRSFHKGCMDDEVPAKDEPFYCPVCVEEDFIDDADEEGVRKEVTELIPSVFGKFSITRANIERNINVENGAHKASTKKRLLTREDDAAAAVGLDGVRATIITTSSHKKQFGDDANPSACRMTGALKCFVNAKNEDFNRITAEIEAKPENGFVTEGMLVREQKYFSSFSDKYKDVVEDEEGVEVDVDEHDEDRRLVATATIAAKDEVDSENPVRALKSEYTRTDKYSPYEDDDDEDVLNYGKDFFKERRKSLGSADEEESEGSDSNSEGEDKKDEVVIDETRSKAAAAVETMVRVVDFKNDKESDKGENDQVVADGKHFEAVAAGVSPLTNPATVSKEPISYVVISDDEDKDEDEQAPKVGPPTTATTFIKPGTPQSRECGNSSASASGSKLSTPAATILNAAPASALKLLTPMADAAITAIVLVAASASALKLLTPTADAALSAAVLTVASTTTSALSSQGMSSQGMSSQGTSQLTVLLPKSQASTSTTGSRQFSSSQDSNESYYNAMTPPSASVTQKVSAIDKIPNPVFSSVEDVKSPLSSSSSPHNVTSSSSSFPRVVVAAPPERRLEAAVVSLTEMEVIDLVDSDSDDDL